jgi:hypothetical protein
MSEADCEAILALNYEFTVDEPNDDFDLDGLVDEDVEDVAEYVYDDDELSE